MGLVSGSFGPTSSFAIFMLAVCLPNCFSTFENCMLDLVTVMDNCYVKFSSEVEHDATESDLANLRRNCSALTELIDCHKNSMYIFNECDRAKKVVVKFINSTRTKYDEACNIPEELKCDPQFEDCGAGSSSVVTSQGFAILSLGLTLSLLLFLS